MPSHTASVVPLGGVSAVSSIGLLLQLLMFSPPVAFENTACSEPSPNSDITKRCLPAHRIRLRESERLIQEILTPWRVLGENT